MQVQLRTDPYITETDGIVTLEEIRRIHRFADVDATGDGVTVAVMDSGIDPTHPVFDGVTVRDGVSFVDGEATADAVGHGTAVAGLIAQLAPDADLLPVRIFGRSGRTGPRVIPRAYDWLVDNADRYDVVNMSWGASVRQRSIDAMHERLLKQGVRDVVAAGNTGNRGGSPATATRAFGVGAITEAGEITRFSSYDPTRDNPDTAALGKNVRLPRATGTSMGQVIDDEWTKGSGTSFSAPIQAAGVARYAERHGLDGAVRSFERTAEDIPETPEDGAGVVKVAPALATAGAGGLASARAEVFAHGSLRTAVIDADWLDSGEYDAVLAEGDPTTIRWRPRK